MAKKEDTLKTLPKDLIIYIIYMLIYMEDICYCATQLCVFTNTGKLGGRSISFSISRKSKDFQAGKARKHV